MALGQIENCYFSFYVEKYAGMHILCANVPRITFSRTFEQLRIRTRLETRNLKFFDSRILNSLKNCCLRTQYFVSKQVRAYPASAATASLRNGAQPKGLHMSIELRSLVRIQLPEAHFTAGDMQLDLGSSLDGQRHIEHSIITSGGIWQRGAM